MDPLRLLMTLAIVLPASSDEGQEVSSGPDQGEKVPALKVFDATGPHKDKEVDYAAERKDKPTIFLFIQAEKWDRPMARFVRKLDDTLQKKDEDGCALRLATPQQLHRKALSSTESPIPHTFRRRVAKTRVARGAVRDAR
jgi:hypothetical protein